MSYEVFLKNKDWMEATLAAIIEAELTAMGDAAKELTWFSSTAKCLTIPN